MFQNRWGPLTDHLLFAKKKKKKKTNFNFPRSELFFCSCQYAQRANVYYLFFFFYTGLESAGKEEEYHS
ncbi:hypothetical protein POVWA1_043080 [Plasmodium ovale wallikeri]|uniref:Uncharacterized protein n=1 Tax=Plasmodium ovale wallikeri TaxID=864142 RepID=A0A1A8ZAN7_PLAOA|nr:hypothetical protein POVWA1_043080 [Plasmodium ovale wallikeri]